MLAVRAICVERQKSSGSLQEYAGPALVSGVLVSSGGQQSCSRPPHSDPSAAQHAFGQACMKMFPAGTARLLQKMEAAAPGGGVVDEPPPL